MAGTKLLIANGKVDAFERDALGKAIAGFWLGDCPTAKFAFKTERKDWKESYSGSNSIIGSATISNEATLEVKLASVTGKNLSDACYANLITVAAGTAVAEALGTGATVGEVKYLKHVNCSSVVISEAGVPLVAGTDYTVDPKNGRVEFLVAQTGAITADYAYATYTGVGPFTKEAPIRTIIIATINKMDGKPVRYRFPLCRAEPLDELNAISNDYITPTVKFTVQLDETLDPEGEFGQFAEILQG
jgi:hypothetical protein